jgi:lysophospholipase L1-like esterase
MEGCTWGTLGGHPCTQAGFAGAFLQNVINHAPQAIANLQAGAVVIQVGINNVFLLPTDPQNVSFAADYATLIRDIAATTSRIVCTTVVPMEKGFGVPDQDVQERSQWASDLSQQIVTVAKQSMLPCVDLNGAFRQADLTALPGMTIDGIHFSALGWASIRQLLDPAVAAVFNF